MRVSFEQTLNDVYIYRQSVPRVIDHLDRLKMWVRKMSDQAYASGASNVRVTISLGNGKAVVRVEGTS